jgi:hypothetical protein
MKQYNFESHTISGTECAFEGARKIALKQMKFLPSHA